MSPQIQFPDLETLFGSSSFCPCAECGSLLSPAAYLVDMLHSILESKISARDQKNVLLRWGADILFDRRPDIEHIELTCQNAKTPVPYVDLVNEILENAIAHVDTFPQTTGTAEEVAANPEHVNDAVYNILKQAVYPPALP